MAFLVDHLAPGRLVSFRFVPDHHDDLGYLVPRQACFFGIRRGCVFSGEGGGVS